MSVFAFLLLIPQHHTDCLLSLAQEKEHFHSAWLVASSFFKGSVLLIALLSSFTLTLLCYNQEADHLANLGADGIQKITVENKRQRREVEGGARILGRWQKKDGTSGCGIVIKGVDRDKWITYQQDCRTLGGVLRPVREVLRILSFAFSVCFVASFVVSSCSFL